MSSWAEYLQNCIKNHHIITIFFDNTDIIDVGQAGISPSDIYCGEYCLTIFDVNKEIDYPYHRITKIIKYGDRI